MDETRSASPGGASASDAAAAPDFAATYVPDWAAAPPSETAPFVLAALLPTSPCFAPPTLFRPAAALAAAAAGASAPATDDHADEAVRGDLARAQHGVSGAGITIGILSDSFDVLGGAARDVADGDLPPGVRVLEEGPAGSHDEGRAMAELIHRIAPGAQIVFHTAALGEADFAAGIGALAAAGCNVIVDDVAYLDEPFFAADGAVQQAVARAVAGGASYFTAAGNEGVDYIQQSFTPLHLTLPDLPPGASVQDFGTLAAPQPWLDVTIPPGGAGAFALQWDQPDGGSADSLGLALYDQSGHLLASAAADRTGGAPAQVLRFANSHQASAFRLVLYMNGGAVPPGLFKIIGFGDATIASPFAGSGSGSVLGHEIVPGANTVGAMAWSAAPRFGGADTPEPFSSVGSGTILFGPDGTRLAQPLSTQKVDFLAPDGSVTSALAPFFGTSAAAANAAGVAALVLQADPALSPAALSAVLAETAVPALGPASAAGAGLLDTNAAVAMALSLAHGH